MTAPPGSFIHISLRIGRPRISTKLGFNAQIIIYCILEMDKHEHKRLILHFKAHVFLLLFKEMSYSLRCSLCHKRVGYKVLIKCFHDKLNVSLFIS